MDWFYILFTLIGLIYLLSGIYEWKKSWRLNIGIYLPNLIGEQKTRLLYIFVGGSIFGIGISLSMQSLFSNNSIFFLILGFFISISVIWFLFRLYEGTPITEFIRDNLNNSINKKPPAIT